MGVNGLLPLLKSIHDPCSLERYRGKTLAIDTYGWLHRAVVSCAEDLCLGRPTRRYVTYVRNKIAMLQDFQITPYFVFDGASLRTKAQTNDERRKSRKEALALAQQYTKLGRSDLAGKQYMKAACVTSQMAKLIMCELDLLKIKYVVAPYEADPQMVYLEKIGLVDGILSEDSDLLIFGCRKLITKLKDDSTCVEIDRHNFKNVTNMSYLGNFSESQLRLAAMLSGCDYTKGVQGIGLKSSVQLVRKYIYLQKVILAIKASGKMVPDNLEDDIYRADLAFQFQKVFDPRSQKLTTLNELPEELEVDVEILEMYCGRCIDDRLIQHVCNGVIDPNTHEPLISRDQSLSLLKSHSLRMGMSSVTTTTTNNNNSDDDNNNNNKVNQSLSSMNCRVARRSQSETIGKGSPNSILDMLSFSKCSPKRTKRRLEAEADITVQLELEAKEKARVKSITHTNTSIEHEQHNATFREPDLPVKKIFFDKSRLKNDTSPTSKKLKKLQSPLSLQKTPTTTSKYFSAPKVKKVENDEDPEIWNSSFFEDSEVPESSPKFGFDTRDILADFEKDTVSTNVDDTEIEIETEAEDEHGNENENELGNENENETTTIDADVDVDEQIVDSLPNFDSMIVDVAPISILRSKVRRMQTTEKQETRREFEVANTDDDNDYDDDDEIEESPIRKDYSQNTSTIRTQVDFKALRSAFQCHADNLNLPLGQKPHKPQAQLSQKHSDYRKKRPALQDKPVNTMPKSIQKVTAHIRDNTESRKGEIEKKVRFKTKSPLPKRVCKRIDLKQFVY